jgi:polyferredoxin
MDNLFGKRLRLFRPRSIWIRRVVQWFFFILIALIAINHTLAESGAAIPILSSASLHAVCPFGGVETLYTFISSGLFVKKIHESSLVLMGISLVLAVVFGPVFCGWVCPLGTVQEWVGKLGHNSSNAATTISSPSNWIKSYATPATGFWSGCSTSPP